MDPRLTEKQARLLKFIRDYATHRGYPPSLREMADFMGVRALSTVHQHLATLQEKGLVGRAAERARNVSIENVPKLVKVPILGEIAAGLPIEPIEDPEPYYVSTDIIKSSANHYALRVRGDSMIDDGVQDGDVVVIKAQNYVDRTGQTIVAITNNEATLKRFGGVEDGMVKLVPRNPRLSPMFVDPYTFEVRGVMVGLIRGA